MSQDSMTSGWYYAKAGGAEGNEVGPLTWDELYRLAESGVVEPHDIVWNPKLPRGVTAGLIPELFPGLQVAQVPVAQAAPQPASEPAPPQSVAAAPVPVVPVVPEPQPAAPEPAPAEPKIVEPASGLGASSTATAAVVGESAAVGLTGEVFTEEAVKSRPKKAKEPKTRPQSRSLPALILLLVAVIAAAGLAAYFLYFRDVGTQGQSQEGIGFELPVAAQAYDARSADSLSIT